MRRRRLGFLPLAVIAAGTVILLYLLLPSQVWWFLLALGLIWFGLWMLRCC
ncbi:MAG: hypothetical protein IJI27_08485 [Oscillospiraceae bacterium]|nr:hypothetical protein [Oscillospiraceae bacterium]